ncbi:ATP synthase subunit I [Methylophaga sp. OBS3]|jgi:ATP synthase protein I|uniref:ATP synthase subunit I n=1 Tax=Methylophaga sp. OBS3 TaxID=2991934 RepID=UPI00225224A2|nr:ATP synthase subunit I [Methylophaga sp. OBS3]MCX4189817.1 ATP synthase subunit I [Methylophaga sp. OBS3]
MDRLVNAQPINQVLLWQCVALVLITIVVLVWQGMFAAVATLYGAAMAIFNTLLMKWHLHRAAHTARADAGKNLSKAYRCVIERWFSSLVLFAFGFAVLALAPFPLLLGFALTQLMLFLGYTNRA